MADAASAASSQCAPRSGRTRSSGLPRTSPRKRLLESLSRSTIQSGSRRRASARSRGWPVKVHARLTRTMVVVLEESWGEAFLSCPSGATSPHLGGCQSQPRAGARPCASPFGNGTQPGPVRYHVVRTSDGPTTHLSFEPGQSSHADGPARASSLPAAAVTRRRRDDRRVRAGRGSDPEGFLRSGHGAASRAWPGCG